LMYRCTWMDSDAFKKKMLGIENNFYMDGHGEAPG